MNEWFPTDRAQRQAWAMTGELAARQMRLGFAMARAMTLLHPVRLAFAMMAGQGVLRAPEGKTLASVIAEASPGARTAEAASGTAALSDTLLCDKGLSGGSLSDTGTPETPPAQPGRRKGQRRKPAPPPEMPPLRAIPGGAAGGR